MMKDQYTKKNRIFFFEDFSAKDLNENKVGRKGLSLFQLKDMDVPVPEFFVLSGDVFSDFCFKTLNDSKEKLLEKNRNPESEEIRDLFLKSEFDKEVQEEILSSYTRISGFTDAWVSVRSSVIFPENETVSFSGIFGTQLNVRKFEDLKLAIKKVYSSMFTDDVVAYASKMGIDISQVRIAVVVQRMVQSEISGVVFTIDPITQDQTKLGIEAVYGLGDVISLGEITPDSYLVNKRDLSILEKHISPQEWMKVRTMQSSSSRKGSVEKVKISNTWSHRQKLGDKEMQEISKVALIVENKTRNHQNLEWVFSGGRLWILQNKPLYSEVLQYRVDTQNSEVARKSLRDFVIGFIEKFKSKEEIVSLAMDKAQKIVMKNNSSIGSRLEELINSARTKKEEVQKEQLESKQDFLASGTGASFGNLVGRISVVNNVTNARYTKEDILLITRYSSEMESMIVSCGGVIMETGGITSDTALLCRELKIPAIVGVLNASDIMKDGDWVRIDGNTGSIYRESKVPIAEVHPVVESYVEGNVTSGVDLLQEEEMPEIKNESIIPKDLTLPPSATKVFSMGNMQPSQLMEYVGNSNGLVYLDLDKILLADGRHLLAYVEEKKFVDYANKISEKIIDYVNLCQGNEVILSIGSASIGEFKDLTRGKQYEDDTLSNDVSGAVHYVNNKPLLQRVLKIVRRVRNIHKKRNVSLAIHSPMNEDVVKEFKKYLSTEGLRRTSTFKIYVVLDNPSQIIQADDIVNTKIDGLILNMPKIARQMQGIKSSDKDGKYDLGRNSIFRVVDNVMDLVKRSESRVIVIAEDSKPLIKHSVQLGVYGVSVYPQDIVETRKVVSEEETKLILGK